MEKPLIILLHGILRSNLDMIPIERQLEKRGYDCLNIKYPSNKHTIEDLADIVYKRIDEDERFHSAPEVNFVTHSMGGLLAREIIARNRPENLGRVVMMGTPNQGSEVADYLEEKHSLLRKAFRWVFGPAGSQLRTQQDRTDGNKVDYEVGIIASDFSLNPLAREMFDEPNDTLVTVEGTKLEGMKDHIVVPSTHAIMMFDPRVLYQVIRFLKKGSFNQDAVKKKQENLPESPDGPE